MARWIPDERTSLDALAAQIAAVYAGIERDLTRLAALQLAAGLKAGETNAARALSISVLREQAQRSVQALRKTTPDTVRQLLTTAGDRGILAALREVNHLPGVAPTHAPARPHISGGAIAALTADLTSTLTQVGHRILRFPDDLYRRAVASATTTVLMGGTSGMSQQRAWQQLLAGGISGFTDKAGRNWNLATYVEMATRTAARKAWEDQHIDTIDSAGLDYMTPVVGNDSCKRCADWSGKILTIRGHAGLRPATSTITGQPVEVHIDGTVDVWRSQRHPNCTCRLVAWQPGTKPPKATTYNPKREAERAKLRHLERQVRREKLHGAAALDSTAERASNAKLRQLQGRIREHVQDTGLNRQRQRERVNLGRSMNPESTTPVAGPASQVADAGSVELALAKIKPVATYPPVGQDGGDIPFTPATRPHLDDETLGHILDGHLHGANERRRAAAKAGEKVKWKNEFPSHWGPTIIGRAIAATIADPDRIWRSGSTLYFSRQIDDQVVEVRLRGRPGPGEIWTAYPVTPKVK